MEALPAADFAFFWGRKFFNEKTGWDLGGLPVDNRTLSWPAPICASVQRVPQTWRWRWRQSDSACTERLARQSGPAGTCPGPQRIHIHIRTTLSDSTRLTNSITDKKSRTFQDTMKNFPGPFRSPRMFEYKEKTAFTYNKPVVDVARDAQCCVHTRDSSCRGQTQMDRWMDGHCATIRASLACASRANIQSVVHCRKFSIKQNVVVSCSKFWKTGCYTIAACLPFEPLEKCMTFKDIFPGLPGP